MDLIATTYSHYTDTGRHSVAMQYYITPSEIVLSLKRSHIPNTSSQMFENHKVR